MNSNKKLDFISVSGHTRRDIYHLCMLCFICLLGPFAFFDVSKTKLLQLFTSALRWTSFISMIGTILQTLKFKVKTKY